MFILKEKLTIIAMKHVLIVKLNLIMIIVILEDLFQKNMNLMNKRKIFKH
jgi:hypothetical protein